jgi:hypothetical protein
MAQASTGRSFLEKLAQYVNSRARLLIADILTAVYDCESSRLSSGWLQK